MMRDLAMIAIGLAVLIGGTAVGWALAKIFLPWIG